MDISVSLPPDLAAFIRSKRETGRYSSAGDVIREALAQMEGADRLRAAWVEGVNSGDDGNMDFAELRAEARRRLEISHQAETGGPE